MPGSVNLFCVPYAGGNAYSYRSLEQRMPQAIKVRPLELPGRGQRSNESRATSLQEMALDLLAVMRPSLNQPYALFGHSMGAFVAYLISCQLVRECLPLPSHLFLSGKGPPHRSSGEAPWHALPLGEFKLKLAELGGCPAAVLDNRELMDYFAPMIRDDMRIISEYQHNHVPPLAVPITVMIGAADNTTKAQAAGWNELTTAGFRLLQYEGGHFFWLDHLDDICELMRSTLKSINEQVA